MSLPSTPLPPPAAKYPLFRAPEKYMATRARGGLRGWLKARREHRALARCLKGLPGLRTVCDVPSGPGRLFALWRSHGLAVIGLDLAPEMTGSASRMHRALGLGGRVGAGDAFHLSAALPEGADLIACVRFMYYFDQRERIALWRSLAAASHRHVVVQLRTSETLRGQLVAARTEANLRRRRARHLTRRLCSHADIAHEVAAAGLRLVRIVPMGELSDRVFVLAEKPAKPTWIPTVPTVAPIHRGRWSPAGLAIRGLVAACGWAASLRRPVRRVREAPAASN